MSHFPEYFIELYLKLPIPLRTYWNFEDNCQMIEVGTNDLETLRSHADDWLSLGPQIRDLVTVNMQATIASQNLWPTTHPVAQGLIADLNVVKNSLGYNSILTFLEDESHIVTRMFHDYFKEHQYGTL